MARPIDDIAHAFEEAIIGALKDREGELKAIAEAGGDKAGHGILGDIGVISDIFSNIVTSIPVLGDLLGLGLEPLKAMEGAGGHLGNGFGIGYFAGYFAWQLGQPALRTYIQDAERAFHSLPLDPDVAAGLVAKGLYTEDEGRGEAEASGLDGHKSDLLIDAARARPDVMTLMDLRNRGLIGDDDVTVALQRHGYPAQWIAALVGLRRQLLSPAELALASLKGVLDEDTARAYAKELGIDSADFDVMLGDTGEPPGIMELLEAFRRGFIDEPRLVHGIRQSRLRNEWVDVIEKLRYSPMSTADAVRAQVEGHIKEDFGRAVAEQNGLTPEHYPILVEAWGRPPSHEQMLELYHRGQATLDEVKQAILESDVKNKYVDKLIDLGRELIPQRTIVSMVDHKVIDHDTAIGLLEIHGYSAEDADRLVKLGSAQRTTSHHDLSKSDILAMYTDALMNRVQARDHLAKLGYQPEDAVQMLDLADYRRKASQLKIVERGIQASLKAHHITEQQALAQLTNAGLDHEQAQILVDEWLQERRIVTRTLSEAQIVKAVNDFVITPEDGRGRLRALGYADVDIDILYKDRGIMPFTNAWAPQSAPAPPSSGGPAPGATP